MCKKLIYLLSLVFVLSMVLTGSASAADPNLQLWLEFEDNANDSSNYGRTTLVTGSLTYGTGVIGQAADLGGSANYVTTPGYKGVLGANPFSITAWCLPDTGNDGDFVAWGSTAGGATRFEFRSDGDRLRAESGGNNRGDATWNQDGEWHHVAVTVPPNGTIATLKLYLDGFYDYRSNSSSTPLAMASGYDVHIGVRHSDQSRNLNTWMDDLRIYDYELSADEIRILAGAFEPILEYPADEAALAAPGTTLKWTPGVYAANVNGYEVYISDIFEDVNSGAGDPCATLNGDVNSCFVDLPVGNLYYWKVDAVNDSPPPGRWSSEIWSFLVPAYEAWDPFPPDEQKFVDPNVKLEWKMGMGGFKSDVYFGTNFDDVNDDTFGVGTWKLQQTQTIYDPAGALAKDANYYWRIDTYPTVGPMAKGTVWTFTTMPFKPILDPNLVGYWKLDDEGSSVIAVDDSGYNHYGTLYGGASYVAGYLDQAVQLDGIDDYVSIDQGNGYKGILGTHAFSAAAWIKTVDPNVNINDQSNIVCWGTHSGGQRVEFRIQGSRLRVSHGSGNVQGDTTVNDAEWHHVVMTVIDSAELSSSDVRVYVDGFDDTQTSSDPDTFNIVADADLGIGYRATNSTRFFAGLIDEVRLYDYVLSPGEVVQLVYPGRAYNPSPIDRAQDVSKWAKLTWTPATDEFTDNPYTRHDLYFGTNFEDVNAGNVTPIRITGPTEYDPDLDYYNFYYWRVDEVNDSEEAVRGFVWSFKATYDPNLVLDPNLVGHWKLDDVDSGVMAVDDSGYDHLGTLHNGASYVAGYLDQAVQFDGIDDYVSIDQGGQVEGYKGVLGTNPFSVAAWIKTTDSAGEIVCWGTQSGGERVEFRINSSRLRVDFGNGNVQGDTTVNDGEWHHVATTVGSGGVISSSNIGFYVDGFDDTRSSSDPDTFDIVADADLGIGYRATNGDRFFEGLIDEVRLYGYVLSPGKVRQLAGLETAYNPSPIDDARNVPLNTKLTWTPATDEFTGSEYTKHDVYFSTNFEDVNEGKVIPITIDDGNEHAPALDYINYVIGDGWYYWRVDEVNDSDEAIRGFVWRFSTTSDPNQHVDPNLLAWYKFDGDATDSSGRCLHLTEYGEPAYTAGFEDQAINLDGIDDYADYTFPAEDRLAYTVTAWVRADILGQANFTSVFSSHTPNNEGFQLDIFGTNPGNYRYHDGFDKLLGPVATGWVHLAVTCDGTRTSLYYNGSFVPDVETTPDLVFNRYTVGRNRNYGGEFDGLVDEVRIYDYELDDAEILAVMRIDLAQAWMPNPGDGATGVAREPTLSWNPGDYAPGANGHKVYFGADDPCNLALVDTPVQPQTPNNFEPGVLDLGRTYYWAVDEVNTHGGVNPGKIWSFTVIDYMVVDDFDSYPGAGGGASDPCMWEVWLDGAGDCPGTNNTNSGAILYEDVNTTRGGSAGSMRYVYDNDGTVEIHPCGGGPLIRPWYSRGMAQIADLPSGIDPNWLAGGAKALSLRFNGEPNNTIELLWVELEDGSANKAKVFYGMYDDEDPNDFNDGAWRQWSIALDDFTGVDESNVKSITIGIGDEGAASPGETGTLYIEDIRLYPPRCFPLRAKPGADFSNDCEVGYPDLEILTDDWLIGGYEFDVAGSVSDANLEVHYEFENNLNDSSGNLRHADPCGTISYAAGIVGANAVDLDVNDYAVADYNGVTGPNSRTCCAWIKTTDVDGGDFISWGTNSAGQKWILRIEPDDGYLRAEFGGTRYIVGSTDLRDGQWYHVAIVLDSDGTPEVQDLELYVDGMRELLSDVANGAIDTADGANLHIGRSPWNPLRPFEGQIDDLQIYSRALGHDEVAKLAGLTGTIEQPLLPLLTTPEDTDLFDDEIINFKDYARLLDEWLDEELWP